MILRNLDSVVVAANLTITTLGYLTSRHDSGMSYDVLDAFRLPVVAMLLLSSMKFCMSLVEVVPTKPTCVICPPSSCRVSDLACQTHALVHIRHPAQRWSMTQNSRLGPNGGRDHVMASNGTQVFVLGGLSSALPTARAQADRTALVYVLHPGGYSFCHFIWTASNFESAELIKLNPDPNAVEPNETREATQVSWKSSEDSWTPKHPNRPTSSSSDAYATHRASPFQKATPDKLGRTASPQIIHERYPTSNGLLSLPLGVDVSSEGEVARLEQERLLELERQLSATLAAQSERDQRLAQLTDELARKSALLEQAQANAVEATKRAGLEPHEQANQLLAQTSRVEQKDAELVKMQAKLDELLLSHDQHVHVSGQRIGQYETELAGVRAELEAKKSELEAVRLQLTDGKNGWAKSKAEADTSRGMTTASLASTENSEDQITRVLVERIRAMEAEIASLRWSEKGWEDMPTRNEG